MGIGVDCTGLYNISMGCVKSQLVLNDRKLLNGARFILYHTTGEYSLVAKV